MLRDNLQLAVEEAERFLARAKRLLSDDKLLDSPYLYGSDAAAVRRASMDLTKALPNVRRYR